MKERLFGGKKSVWSLSLRSSDYHLHNVWCTFLATGFRIMFSYWSFTLRLHIFTTTSFSEHDNGTPEQNKIKPGIISKFYLKQWLNKIHLLDYQSSWERGAFSPRLLFFNLFSFLNRIKHEIALMCSMMCLPTWTLLWTLYQFSM